jgi:predicted GNAT superfamily acetyltransferase
VAEIASTLVHDAEVSAALAAAAADVAIDTIDAVADLQDLRELMHQIWGPEIVPPRNLLRGMAMAGSGIALARRAGEAVGFSIGLLGWTGGVHFHSHQVGVLAAERGSGVGYALKLAQRSQCLAHGVTEMRWTFDPLLASNAAFNLVRLGATITTFIPDCYGARTDAFNTGDVTDRVKVSWRLDRPVGAPALSPDMAAEPLIALVDDGPRVARSVALARPGAFIPLPDGYHLLRGEHPAAAASWRNATGAAFVDCFESRLNIVGYGPLGYVVGEAL